MYLAGDSPITKTICFLLSKIKGTEPRKKIEENIIRSLEPKGISLKIVGLKKESAINAVVKTPSPTIKTIRGYFEHEAVRNVPLRAGDDIKLDGNGSDGVKKFVNDQESHYKAYKRW